LLKAAIIIIAAIPKTTIIAQVQSSGFTRTRYLDVGLTLALLDITIDHADMPNIDAALYEGAIAKDTADIRENVNNVLKQLFFNCLEIDANLDDYLRNQADFTSDNRN
jgi:hypothetical protein